MKLIEEILSDLNKAISVNYGHQDAIKTIRMDSRAFESIRHDLLMRGGFIYRTDNQKIFTEICGITVSPVYTSPADKEQK